MVWMHSLYYTWSTLFATLSLYLHSLSRDYVKLNQHRNGSLWWIIMREYADCRLCSYYLGNSKMKMNETENYGATVQSFVIKSWYWCRCQMPMLIHHSTLCRIEAAWNVMIVHLHTMSFDYFVSYLLNWIPFAFIPVQMCRLFHFP